MTIEAPMQFAVDSDVIAWRFCGDAEKGEVEELCEVVPLTLEAHGEARRIGEHYGG